MKTGYLFTTNLFLIQKVSKDFIGGEIYIKVQQKPLSNSTK